MKTATKRYLITLKSNQIKLSIIRKTARDPGSQASYPQQLCREQGKVDGTKQPSPMSARLPSLTPASGALQETMCQYLPASIFWGWRAGWQIPALRRITPLERIPSSENKDSREKGMPNSQETMTRPNLPTSLKASSSRPPKSLPPPDYQVFLCSSTGVSPLFPFQTLKEGPRDTKGSSFAATKKEQGMTLPKQNNRKGWVGKAIKRSNLGPAGTGGMGGVISVT